MEVDPWERSDPWGGGLDRGVYRARSFTSPRSSQWTESEPLRAPGPGSSYIAEVVKAGGSRHVVAAVVATLWRLDKGEGADSQEIMKRTQHMKDSFRVQEALAQHGYHEHCLGASIAAARGAGLLDRESGRAARRVQRRANSARHSVFAAQSETSDAQLKMEQAGQETFDWHDKNKHSEEYELEGKQKEFDDDFATMNGDIAKLQANVTLEDAPAPYLEKRVVDSTDADTQVQLKRADEAHEKKLDTLSQGNFVTHSELKKSIRALESAMTKVTSTLIYDSGSQTIGKIKDEIRTILPPSQSAGAH